jgi:hypothetical protein
VKKAARRLPDGGEASRRVVTDIFQLAQLWSIIYQTNVRARAPLPAGVRADYGVGVVAMENHLNRTAGSGCTVRLVRLGKF